MCMYMVCVWYHIYSVCVLCMYVGMNVCVCVYVCVCVMCVCVMFYVYVCVVLEICVWGL